MVTQGINIIKGYCPTCEKEDADLELIQGTEVLNIRDERIPVETSYYQCQKCASKFDSPDAPDYMKEAYRIYRQRKHLLQPEEIATYRKQYDLTQRELSRLLGWGDVTISRYENGALQNEGQNAELKLAFEPANLMRLIAENPTVLHEDKVKPLLEILKNETRKNYLMNSLEMLLDYEADILSGYKTADIGRIINAVLFFCEQTEVARTKMYKLLFYADSKHFKDYTVSITGLRYAHLPLGPVPDKHNYCFSALTQIDPALAIEERQWSEVIGEVFMAKRRPDLSLFVDSELKTLLYVKEFFESYSAKGISDFSHNEIGYIKTNTGQLIPYSFPVGI